MAVVQGLAHFILIAFGTVIRDLGVSLEDLEEFSTPTFATLHNLTRRLLSQDAKLYACIQLQNPANRMALRALEDAVADILYFIQRQNADGLVRLIEGVKEGFAEEDNDKAGRRLRNADLVRARLPRPRAGVETPALTVIAILTFINGRYPCWI